MLKGTHVRISKEWHKPEIKIEVLHEAGSVILGMDLRDFVVAMAAEAGSPATLLTKAQLERKLLEAAGVVTEKMKGETTAIA